MSPDHPNAMSGDQWREILANIGRELKQPANLCLIGSGPAIFKGQDDRLTIDLDSLRRRSRFNEADMRQACDRAGVLLDPKDAEPNHPYIQLVDDDDGIVYLGKFKETLPVLTAGRLNVEQAPWANIIASKLVRGGPRDMADAMHIMTHHPATAADVLTVAKGFPNLVRENVEETLAFIALIQRSAPVAPAPAKSFSRGQQPVAEIDTP